MIHPYIMLPQEFNTADERVNVQNATAFGTAMIYSMVGKCVLEHCFKKKNQVVTMASVTVMSQQLRHVTTGMKNDQLLEIFQFAFSFF